MYPFFLLQSSTWLWTIIWCSTCSFYRVSRDCERWSDVTLVLSTEHNALTGDLIFPLFLPQINTWLWTVIWCSPYPSPFSFHRVPRDCERRSDVRLVLSIEYHMIVNGDLMFPLFLPQSTMWSWIWRSPCSFHRVPRNLMFSLFLPQSALSVPIPQQPPPSPEPSQASQPPPPLLKPSIKIPTARTESKTNSTAGSDVSKKSVPSTRPCAKRAKPDSKRPAKKPPAGQTAALRPNMDAKTRPKSVNIQQPTPRDTHRWVTSYNFTKTEICNCANIVVTDGTKSYFATSVGNVSLMTTESRELPWQPRMAADVANLASWRNIYSLIFLTVFGHSLPIISTLALSSMSKCGVSICCAQYVTCFPICYPCSVLYCCHIAR